MISPWAQQERHSNCHPPARPASARRKGGGLGAPQPACPRRPRVVFRQRQSFRAALPSAWSRSDTSRLNRPVGLPLCVHHAFVSIASPSSLRVEFGSNSSMVVPRANALTESSVAHSACWGLGYLYSRMSAPISSDLGRLCVAVRWQIGTYNVIL